MKKIGFLMVIIFLIYIIQYDIRYGTLIPVKAVPVSTQTTKSPSPVKAKTTAPYIRVKVKAGDTVLSIVEQLTQDSVPVSIDKVITDFKALNKGMSPENIQIGKEYKFPVYKKT
ncbi:hypothetical protein J2S09_002030 [Bacillus fengqiuensis]|nr:hypothetical protein [Bacillus fengqiuensis]